MDTNRKYIIFNLSEVDKVNFDLISITSVDTIRKSLDGTKGIIKWDGNEPEFLTTLQTKSSIYNIEEILPILDTEEWTVPITQSGTTIN
jgi:hypothetical protein